MTSILAAAARTMHWASALAVVLIAALVVLASIMRYVVGSPFPFTEEAVGLLFLTMVFGTIPMATLKDQHIAVDLLHSVAGKGVRRLLHLSQLAVLLIFSAWFTWEAIDYARLSFRLGARSEQVAIRLWPWIAIMPVTMATVGAIAATKLLRRPDPVAPPAQAAPPGHGRSS